jgi:DNA-binding response OmpR family regulator
MTPDNQIDPPCVAIVEDEPVLREEMAFQLRHIGFRVEAYENAVQLYRGLAVLSFAVVVLDIGLPGEDGLGVAGLLKTIPHVAIIILSARDGLDDRLSGLRAGADRYLVKPVNLAELAANIDAVAKRLTLSSTRSTLELPRPVLDHSASQWSLNLQSWLLTAPNGQSLQLTAREFSLVHHLIKVQGQAVPKKDLVDEIFGQRIVNAADRLNVLITRLRKKAEAQLNNTLPIKTAHQIGYAFTAPAHLL